MNTPRKITNDYSLRQQLLEILISKGYPDDSFYTDFNIEGINYDLVILDPETKKLLAIYEFDISGPVVITTANLRRIIGKYALLTSNPKIHLYIAHAFQDKESFSVSKILYQTKNSESPLHVNQLEMVDFYTLKNKVLGDELFSADKNKPVSKLKIKISEINKLKVSTPWGAEYKIWDEAVKKLVSDIFGEKGLDLFQKQQTVIASEEGYQSELDERRLLLDGMINNIDDYSQASFIIEKENLFDSVTTQKEQFIKFKNQILGGAALRDTNAYAEILGDIDFQFWRYIHEMAPYLRAGSEMRLDNITKGKIILERMEVEPSPKRFAELLSAGYEALSFYSYTPRNLGDSMWGAYVSRLQGAQQVSGFTDLSISWTTKPGEDFTDPPFVERYYTPGALEITYNGEDWGVEESRKLLEVGFVSKVLNEVIEKRSKEPAKPIHKPWYEKPTGTVLLTIASGLILAGIVFKLGWN